MKDKIKLSDHFGPGVCKGLFAAFGAEYVDDLIGKTDKEIYYNVRGVGKKFFSILRELQMKNATDFVTVYVLRKVFNHPLKGVHYKGTQFTPEECAFMLGHNLTAESFSEQWERSPQLQLWFHKVVRPAMK